MLDSEGVFGTNVLVNVLSTLPVLLLIVIVFVLKLLLLLKLALLLLLVLLLIVLVTDATAFEWLILVELVVRFRVSF